MDFWDILKWTPTFNVKMWIRIGIAVSGFVFYKSCTGGSSPHDVEKAAIKARLLTGCYTLQAQKHKFNQYEVDKTCLLCCKETEDREHFILRCEALQKTREKHLSKLFTILPSILEHKDMLMQCILDSSHQDLEHIIPTRGNTHQKIEEITRSLLYELHVHRSRILPNK